MFICFSCSVTCVYALDYSRYYTIIIMGAGECRKRIHTAFYEHILDGLAILALNIQRKVLTFDVCACGFQITLMLI
jgi:hypothetical protein